MQPHKFRIHFLLFVAAAANSLERVYEANERRPCLEPIARISVLHLYINILKLVTQQETSLQIFNVIYLLLQ